jgi:hypothetical protein
MPVSEPEPDTVYIDSGATDDIDLTLDGELCDGVLLAQDQDGNTYILERDHTVCDKDAEEDPRVYLALGSALTWHRLGACETRDNGKPFIDRISAIRWVLEQGWWVWHAKDGDEAQKWAGEQLRKQTEEVAMV